MSASSSRISVSRIKISSKTRVSKVSRIRTKKNRKHYSSTGDIKSSITTNTPIELLSKKNSISNPTSLSNINSNEKFAADKRRSINSNKENAGSHYVSQPHQSSANRKNELEERSMRPSVNVERVKDKNTLKKSIKVSTTKLTRYQDVTNDLNQPNSPGKLRSSKELLHQTKFSKDIEEEEANENKRKRSKIAGKYCRCTRLCIFCSVIGAILLGAAIAAALLATLNTSKATTKAITTGTPISTTAMASTSSTTATTTSTTVTTTSTTSTSTSATVTTTSTTSTTTSAMVTTTSTTSTTTSTTVTTTSTTSTTTSTTVTTTSTTSTTTSTTVTTTSTTSTTTSATMTTTSTTSTTTSATVTTTSTTSTTTSTTVTMASTAVTTTSTMMTTTSTTVTMASTAVTTTSTTVTITSTTTITTSSTVSTSSTITTTDTATTTSQTTTTTTDTTTPDTTTTTTDTTTTDTSTTTPLTTITYVPTGIWDLHIPTCATWNPTGNTVAGNSNGNVGSSVAALNSPVSIFIDNNYTLYVADRDNARVLKFPINVTTGTVVAGTGTAGSSAIQLNVPRGVAVDQQGAVIVGDSVNYRVQKFPLGFLNGTTIASNNSWDILGITRDLHIDVDNNVYVTDSDYSRIVKFFPGSGIGVILAGAAGVGSAANQLKAPFGIFIDGNQNLYIADQGNNRVQMWQAGATSGTTVAGITGSAGSSLMQLNQPEAVIVDNNGYMYIADNNNNRIVQWTTNYTQGGTCIVGCTRVAGSGATQLNNPRDLKFDADGTLYVSDQGNNRVQKYMIQYPSNCTVNGTTNG